MKPTKEGINAAGKAYRHLPRPTLGIDGAPVHSTSHQYIYSLSLWDSAWVRMKPCELPLAKVYPQWGNDFDNSKGEQQ